MPHAIDPSTHSAISRQSFVEDRVNSTIHGAGLLLALVALPLLILDAISRGGAWHIVSFSVYGATLVAMYGASTFYHATRHEPRKRWLQVVDHSSVYLLIAGTYTPFTVVTLGGGWGWSLFGVVWGLSVVGIALKIWLGDRFEVLSTLVYIALGWLVVIAAGPLLRNLEWGGVLWLVAGGLSYTAGTIFYLWERLPFNHAVWHLFVLGGSVCHFLAVLLFVRTLG